MREGDQTQKRKKKSHETCQSHGTSCWSHGLFLYYGLKRSELKYYYDEFRAKIFFEAIHLVGILGGKSAFSEVFCFFLSILTFPLGFSLFRRENAKYLGILTFPSGFSVFPQYFDFSEGKVEVFYFFQGKMQNTSVF